jgi:hypothetical protein
MADITRCNPRQGLTDFAPFGRDPAHLFKGLFLAPVPFNRIAGSRIPID